MEESCAVEWVRFNTEQPLLKIFMIFKIKNQISVKTFQVGFHFLHHLWVEESFAEAKVIYQKLMSIFENLGDFLSQKLVWFGCRLIGFCGDSASVGLFLLFFSLLADRP